MELKSPYKSANKKTYTDKKSGILNEGKNALANSGWVMCDILMH